MAFSTTASINPKMITLKQNSIVTHTLMELFTKDFVTIQGKDMVTELSYLKMALYTKATGKTVKSMELVD